MFCDGEFVDFSYGVWYCCGNEYYWNLGVVMLSWDLFFGLFNDMFFVVILVVGFVLVFNVFVFVLKYCVLGGVFGYGLCYLMMYFGVLIEWVSFFVVILVGMVGVYWFCCFLVYFKVFMVVVFILMVFGVFVFKVMIVLVEINYVGFLFELMEVLLENFFKVMFIIVGLVVGFVVFGLLFYCCKLII